MDYAVPNFGRDQDIEHTEAHMKAAEEVHGKWNPKWDADDKKFLVPQPIAESDYTNARYMMPDHELLSLWVKTDKVATFRPPADRTPWHEPCVGTGSNCAQKFIDPLTGKPIINSRDSADEAVKDAKDKLDKAVSD